jgi:predicted nuclease with TOPRIM domain
LDTSQLVNLAIGILGGSAAVALINALANRRAVSVSADVTLSADARAWVEQFRAEMDAMASRHKADVSALSQRLDEMTRRLAEVEAENTRLEEENRRLKAENARLETEVMALQLRVQALERVDPND